MFLVAEISRSAVIYQDYQQMAEDFKCESASLASVGVYRVCGLCADSGKRKTRFKKYLQAQFESQAHEFLKLVRHRIISALCVHVKLLSESPWRRGI